MKNWSDTAWDKLWTRKLGSNRKTGKKSTTRGVEKCRVLDASLDAKSGNQPREGPVQVRRARRIISQLRPRMPNPELFSSSLQVKTVKIHP